MIKHFWFEMYEENCKNLKFKFKSSVKEKMKIFGVKFEFLLK